MVYVDNVRLSLGRGSIDSDVTLIKEVLHIMFDLID